MARILASGTSELQARETRNGKADFRAVVFDMDGVIIDSHPTHRKAWRIFLHSMGREVSDAELDFILDGRKRNEILKHFLGNLSEVELDEKGKCKDQFFQELELEVKPIRGVIDFINSLRSKSIAIAIATSASESRARSTLNKLGLIDMFQVVVTGGDVRKGKPDPAIYRMTCERLRLEPKNVLAIEDAVSGVRAAKDAGLSCIGIAGHENPDALIVAGADCVIDNFSGKSKAKLEQIVGNLQSHRPKFSVL
jgi:HAD superfamily hydrolase (TIGR01509 family)